VGGRFPLYTDADVYGPLVDGLMKRGWDVLRAVDAFPEGTDDRTHFERAASEKRMLVACDVHQHQIALEWIRAERPFRGLITWRQTQHQDTSVGAFLEAFEALAAEANPFVYPIRYL
jgi:hypothetical protein